MNASKFYKDSRAYEKLENPNKYKGAVKKIVTRSGWESKFLFNFLDINSNVVEYSSEDVIIPYYSPLDNKMHRYFPDFWFKHKNGKEYIIEIKPFDQLSKPKTPKRRTKSYYQLCEQWVKNKAKFAAAMKYCEELRKRGREIEFSLVTEKQLFG